MYTIHLAHGGKWAIINENAETVFSGTWLECETWLDHAENLAAANRRRPLWSYALGWLQPKAQPNPGEAPTSPGALPTSR